MDKVSDWALAAIPINNNKSSVVILRYIKSIQADAFKCLTNECKQKSPALQQDLRVLFNLLGFFTGTKSKRDNNLKANVSAHIENTPLHTWGCYGVIKIFKPAHV
jgi:hypothetical protein